MIILPVGKQVHSASVLLVIWRWGCYVFLLLSVVLEDLIVIVAFVFVLLVCC
jgi:hypothetical protein